MSEDAEVTRLQEQVARLEAEKHELEEQAVAPATAAARWRGAGAWAMLVIATLLLPLALVGHWGSRTITDNTQFVATMAPLATDQSVQTAVSETVSAQILAQLNLQTVVPEYLPPKAEPLSGAIIGGITTFVNSAVAKLFSSQQFADIWASVSSDLQKATVKALSGDNSGAVQLNGDNLVLDTGTLYQKVKDMLVAKGIGFAANLPLPPAADRQVVLMNAPQLAQARTIYSFTQPIANLLIFFVLLLYLGAILLSTKRWRMVLATGVAMIIGVGLLRLGMVYGPTAFASAFNGTPFEGTQDVIWTTLTAYLKTAIQATFALGVILALIGWLFGGTASGRATRGWITGLLSGAGARTDNPTLGAAGRWVARYRVALLVVIVALVVLYLIAQDRLTAGSLAWAFLWLLVGLVLVEYLAAVGRADAAPVVAGSDGAGEPVAVPVGGPSSDGGEVTLPGA